MNNPFVKTLAYLNAKNIHL